MQHNSAHSESRAGLASGHSRPAAPLAWDHQLQQRFLVAVIKSGGPAEATPAVVMQAMTSDSPIPSLELRHVRERLHGLRRDNGTPPPQRPWCEADPSSAGVGTKRMASTVLEGEEGTNAGPPRASCPPPLLPPNKFRRYQDLQQQIAARQQEMMHHRHQVDEHQSQVTRHAKELAALHEALQEFLLGEYGRVSLQAPQSQAPPPPRPAAAPSTSASWQHGLAAALQAGAASSAPMDPELAAAAMPLLAKLMLAQQYGMQPPVAPPLVRRASYGTLTPQPYPPQLTPPVGRGAQGQHSMSRQMGPAPAWTPPAPVAGAPLPPAPLVTAAAPPAMASQQRLQQPPRSPQQAPPQPHPLQPPPPQAWQPQPAPAAAQPDPQPQPQQHALQFQHQHQLLVQRQHSQQLTLLRAQAQQQAAQQQHQAAVQAAQLQAHLVQHAHLGGQQPKKKTRMQQPSSQSEGPPPAANADPLPLDNRMGWAPVVSLPAAAPAPPPPTDPIGISEWTQRVAYYGNSPPGMAPHREQAPASQHGERSDTQSLLLMPPREPPAQLPFAMRRPATVDGEDLEVEDLLPAWNGTYQL